jgi:putative acetyltransferase
VIVRSETVDDHGAIRAVVEAAMRAEEARLVDLLRDSVHYVPDLALVAEEDGEILGFVMISYAALGDDRVLSLAPVAVAPSRQREGIGTALIEEALRRADAMAEPLVIVLGHASYYPRFGFEPARRHGIEPPDGVPDDVFMVKRLRSYGPAYRGRVVYPPAFDDL